MANPVEITNVSKICSVAFTPDGKHVIGGDEAGVIRRWNIENAQQVGLPMTASDQVLTIAVSKDARWIVTGDWEGNVVVWDASTHQRALKIAVNLVRVWAVDITSDSTRIAAGSNQMTARIFSITDGVELFPALTHDATVIGLRFSPSGDRIATATYMRDSVRVYDTKTGDKLFDIPVSVEGFPVTPLSWSPDGQQLFVVSPGKITCLDVSSSACSDWSTNNSNSQTSIVTNGRFIACCAGTSVSFWEIVSRKQIGRTLTHSAPVQCIAPSPDHGYLACGNGKKIAFHRLSEIIPVNFLSPPIGICQFPLMEVSSSAVKAWMDGDTRQAEIILSEEIERPNSTHYELANRALVRARLKQWSTALEDAKMSIQLKASPIGYIAKALALVGSGEGEVGLSEFDLVFRHCDPWDGVLVFLLSIKSILTFVWGKHEDAIRRIRSLITDADEMTKYYCSQILGNIYVKQGEYRHAIQACKAAPARESPHLKTISLIFRGWTFDGLEAIAWKRLCENMYTSGHIKEFGESLLKMVDPLPEDEKEAAYCRILEETVTRSRDVVLLSWTGRSSAYNSCLPASPVVYGQTTYTPPTLSQGELDSRTVELRTVFSPNSHDTTVIYDRVIRLQPVRFTNRRLLLPCLVFRVRTLTKNQAKTYRAHVTWLGDMELTTDDELPLDKPRRLVLVHPWIRWLCGPEANDGSDDESESDSDIDVCSNPDSRSRSSSDVDLGSEIVHVSLVEEAPSAPLDTYTRALQLIARLGQPFNALLLLKQADGTYKRVASDHEIVVPGLGNNVPKNIHAEVLEIV